MAKQLKESYSSSFNITEDILRASVEFTTAADELHNFISKGFYSRASEFNNMEAAKLIKQCETMLNKIKEQLAHTSSLTSEGFYKEYRKTVNWLNWQLNDISPMDIRAAERKFDDLYETSPAFLKLFRMLPERDQELFFEEDTGRNLKASFVLTLKKLKVI